MSIKSRHDLLRRLRAETLGPSTGVWDEKATKINDRRIPNNLDQTALLGPMYDIDTGQELLHRRRNPKYTYGIGVLVPASNNLMHLEDDRENKLILEEFSIENNLSDGSTIIQDKSNEVGDARATQVRPNLSVAQSSIGITFKAQLKIGSKIIVTLPKEYKVLWSDDNYPCNGIYEIVTITSNSGDNEQKRYLRKNLNPESELKFEFKFEKFQKITEEKKFFQIGNLNLSVICKLRPSSIEDQYICTCLLVNLSNIEQDLSGILFQSLFTVTINGNNSYFIQYESGAEFEAGRDEDDLTLALLYRSVTPWAIGHGCSAAWDYKNNIKPNILWTDVMPSVEIPSITPEITKVDLDGNEILLSISMLELGKPDNWNANLNQLNDLKCEYANWIISQKNNPIISNLPLKLQKKAKEHIQQCEVMLVRIATGIDILSNDKQARESFRLANLAMALQQVSQRDLVRRNYNVGKYASEYINPSESLDKFKNKYWRPFQIAFILGSIASITNPDKYKTERETVDLIWFPTGGGKTEAYLGLVSFTLFFMRMKHGEHAEGTNAFMRYTLRMLTTQQFQRAASLITSMEWIRRQNHNPNNFFSISAGDIFRLGDASFSLGLWVGSSATPNNQIDAVKKYREWLNNGNDHPFPILECPWCRTCLERIESPGIGRRRRPSYKINGYLIEENKLISYCPDTHCDFNTGIPVVFIDEEIYSVPPSLLIGTADKFVQLTFKAEAGAIFGFKENLPYYRRPDLIIQDELHLITGPLGSLYGIYETTIEELCIQDDGVRPKIVCSTATTRGTSSQVLQLFGRGNLQIFPPPALDIGDSFFGKWAKDNDEFKPGRLYVGMLATNYPSQLTSEIRVFSTLYLAANSDVLPLERDPWWTTLAFFTSIKQLAGARSLWGFDIPENIKKLMSWWGITEKRYLQPNNIIELSSRLEAPEVIESMNKLSTRYNIENEQNPPDVCLATNIIEVGIDIPRLSLLVIDGVPGSAARYIQVSGRVGREWERAPGLVFTIYNPSKTRDLSYFEHFTIDHLRLYSAVEPNSVTPYSEECIERHLHAALIAWIRFDTRQANANFTPVIEISINKYKNFIKDRINRTFTTEKSINLALNHVNNRLNYIIKKWKTNPDIENWTVYNANGGIGLILAAGNYYTHDQENAGFITMQALRNVDSSAKLQICPIETVT